MAVSFGSNSAKDEIYDMVLNRNLGVDGKIGYIPIYMTVFI